LLHRIEALKEGMQRTESLKLHPDQSRVAGELQRLHPTAAAAKFAAKPRKRSAPASRKAGR
jgi:hypothetical protein